MTKDEDDFNQNLNPKPPTHHNDNPYDSHISITNNANPQKFIFKESAIKPKSKSKDRDKLHLNRSSSVKRRLKGISNNDQLFNRIIKAGLFLVNKNKVFNATTKLTSESTDTPKPQNNPNMKTQSIQIPKVEEEVLKFPEINDE